MLAAGAQQCPICTLTGYQCDHELVCWMADGLAAGSLLARGIEALAQTAEQVLARARRLQVPPNTPELRALFAVWADADLDEAEEPDCVSWALEVVESWPGIERTEDSNFTILWSNDANAVRNRLEDMRIALEVELCRHPGDLRLVPT